MASQYYPPRARWYRPVFSAMFSIRRAFHLEKARLPASFSCAQFLLSLVLPGFALFAAGRPMWGGIFLAAYGVAAPVFVMALGYELGAIAYGLMISAHASSIIFLEGCWLRDDSRFGVRLALAIPTLLAVWLGIYRPVVQFAERRWCMPMRVQGEVVVIQPRAAPSGLTRGDRVVYSMKQHWAGEAHQGGAVWVQAGLGWGEILGLAGDRVQFFTNSFAVNGVSHPALPHMPGEGETVVPEKQWFIWPQFDISGHGNVGEASLSEMMLRMAAVPENQFVGRPYKHWFWRRQVSP